MDNKSNTFMGNCQKIKLHGMTNMIKIRLEKEILTGYNLNIILLRIIYILY